MYSSIASVKPSCAAPSQQGSLFSEETNEKPAVTENLILCDVPTTRTSITWEKRSSVVYFRALLVIENVHTVMLHSLFLTCVVDIASRYCVVHAGTCYRCVVSWSDTNCMVLPVQ